MKKFLRITAILSLMLMLSLSYPFHTKPHMVEAAASNPARTLIGCIRWDGQSGGDPWNVYQKEVLSMSPNKWHWRLPFYATEPTPDSCTMDGNSQSIVDREIAYAKEAGIDYWAFVYYPASVNSGLDYAYNLYQSSAHKNDVKWCVVIGGEYEGYFNSSLVNEYVSRFKQSNYQKVLGNRPLIYFYSDFTASVAAAVAELRTATKAAGLGDPYVVSMTGNYTTGSIIGPDAYSRYVTGGTKGEPYADVAKREKASWDTDKENGKKVIPIVTSGWDPRPRIDTPPWGDYAAPDGWMQTATVTEFANQLRDAISWRDKNASANEANSVLMYSWNEFAEGGQAICPLLVPGTKTGVNRSMLDAVKSVATGVFKGETNYVKNSTFCADGKPVSTISDWIISSPDGTENAAKAEFANSAGYSGAFHLSHNLSKPYSVTTSQFVNGLDNGAYTIIAMVKSSGGQTRCAMQLTDYGGGDISVGIGATSVWKPVVIHANISGGACRIGFNSISPANRWLMVGSVRMLAGNIPVSSAFSSSIASNLSSSISSSKTSAVSQKSLSAVSAGSTASSSALIQSSDATSSAISPISEVSQNISGESAMASGNTSEQSANSGGAVGGGKGLAIGLIIAALLILAGAGVFIYNKFFRF
ncbi:MAG: glycoside hydrolase family 71/99 protein [Saccharofermentanales bacterium]